MCGKGGFIRGKVVRFGANDLHSCKVVVFGQSGCIWAKLVVIG